MQKLTMKMHRLFFLYLEACRAHLDHVALCNDSFRAMMAASLSTRLEHVVTRHRTKELESVAGYLGEV